MLPVSFSDGTVLRYPAIEDAYELYTKVSSIKDYLKQWLPWVYQCQHAGDSKKFVTQKINERNEHKSLAVLIIRNQKIVGVSELQYFDWKEKTTSLGCWVCYKEGRGAAERLVNI